MLTERILFLKGMNGFSLDEVSGGVTLRSKIRTRSTLELESSQAEWRCR